ARHHAPVRKDAPPSGGDGGGGANDCGAPRQDRALPSASLAAARARQRAGAGERCALRPRVQGPCFLPFRLWFYVLPALPAIGLAVILGALGSAAVMFGSVLALRQPRLKLLIAYSTIAQIGYLFLIFPLGSGLHAWTADGWNGGLMQVLAHA